MPYFEFLKKASKSTGNELDAKAKLLIGATVASGTTAVTAGAASVPFLAGFTTSGIAATSMAAGAQSAVGCVTAGSGIAFFQSLAATTIIGTAFPAVVAGAAVAGTVAAGTVLYKHITKEK